MTRYNVQVNTPTSVPKPELLSPAGDWDAIRAAVANGADAVYFGLSDFNARHRATNFSTDELPKIMDYLHDHNVRGYVTFNTLIFSDELPQAVNFIKAMGKARVDAAIVQDLGIVKLIKATAPSLAIHGSTQMTLTEPRGIAFVHDLGVERVILARELSLDNISQITSNSPTPVEVFVHGALCVAYSGQCLTSESLGGRSANRGQCAQACRLPYELIVDHKLHELSDMAYLLSPQDLAAPDLIADLLKNGVVSFKIEGRLKSAHYVAATTQNYRAALDAALDNKPFVQTHQQKLDLEQSFSRGFSHGFLSGVDHQTLVQGRFPKSRGVRIGTVVGKSERGLIVQLDARHAGPPKPPAVKPKYATTGQRPQDDSLPLRAGDGVCFDEGHPEQDEQGGRVFQVRPFNFIVPAGIAKASGPCIEIIFGEGHVNLAAVAVDSLVWKTDDPNLRKRMEQSFKRDQVQHREPLNFVIQGSVGTPLKLTVSDAAGRSATVTSTDPMQLAQRHPLNLATAREQLDRLGDTPFGLGNVTLQEDGKTVDALKVMVPKSVLNELRRNVVDQFQTLRLESELHVTLHDDALEKLRNEITALGSATQQNTSETQPMELCVLVRTLEQLRAVTAWVPAQNAPRPAMVYCDFEDIRRYEEAVAIARQASLPIALATVRIIKPGEEGLLRQVAKCAPDAILVRNLAALSFYREHFSSMNLLGDYSLNVANEITAMLMLKAGLQRMVPSYDLNWRQLEAMLQNFPVNLLEIVIHQHMPMFHMEHCVFAHTLSKGKDHRDCGRPCDRHRVDLRDRVGKDHALIADVGCRNTVYNGQAQSAGELVPRMKKLGLSRFRVELLREDGIETINLLEQYRSILDERPATGSARRELHVLSQLGVTRGTFDFS